MEKDIKMNSKGASKTIALCLICIFMLQSAAYAQGQFLIPPPRVFKPVVVVDPGTDSAADIFTDIDRRHMLEMLDYAKHEISSGELDAELPVVARIVDKDRNTIITTGRKKRDVISTYGVNAYHAEIQAIREAEALGFTDWAGATMYTNLESCFNCSKSITESYGFKRVVYGLKDTTLEEADDYTEGYKRENVRLVKCNDRGIIAELGSLFKEALEKPYNHPLVKAPMHATGLKISGEFRQGFRRIYGEDVQVVVFNADLWVERRNIPWEDHHGNVVYTEERDMFRHIEWHKQNLNPTKKHVLVIVGNNANAAEARKRIAEDGIFENKNIVIYTPEFFFDLKSDTPFVLDTMVLQFVLFVHKKIIIERQIIEELFRELSEIPIPGGIPLKKYLSTNFVNIVGDDILDIKFRERGRLRIIPLGSHEVDRFSGTYDREEKPELFWVTENFLIQYRSDAEPGNVIQRAIRNYVHRGVFHPKDNIIKLEETMRTIDQSKTNDRRTHILIDKEITLTNQALIIQTMHKHSANNLVSEKIYFLDTQQMSDYLSNGNNDCTESNTVVFFVA